MDKFKRILSEMKEAKTQKQINYVLGYSNFAFELWIILHKKDCNGPLSHRSQYLHPINQAFDENFEDLDHYKHEKEFKRCLSKLTIEDVKEAIRRGDIITANNSENENVSIQYKGYAYYRDNPALSIHEVVKNIMKECGVF